VNAARAAGVRPVRLGTADVDVERRPDGTRIVRNREPLGPFPVTLVERLEYWARTAPERTFLAQRAAGGGWRSVSYAQALRDVRALGQALLDLGASAERGVAVLSENGIDHALLGLAAQYAGVPYAPVSPAYSLLSNDFVKLREVVAQVTPAVVYVSDAVRYARALAALAGDAHVVASEPRDTGATAFDALLATAPTAVLDRARGTVHEQTVAKILFTSGSTGSPKGVINTQRMLASNQQMLRQVLPFVADTPPAIVDWLPWNHTFGGNHNFGLILANGGTLYVNDGKPTEAGFAETVRDLREIAPTIYFDVPRGFEMLVHALTAEKALRERFFSRLQLMFYAGAGVAPHVWDALQALAVATTGEQIVMTTSLGSTETAPMALAAPWFATGPGFVGVPAPGVEVKLVPDGEKLELRLRGPNVMPGYWRDPVRTREAFDDEGFYRIGDALRFVDETQPARGFFFDGRLSDDFKLATGTWVNAGAMRMRTIAALAPLVSDVVLSGENRDEIVVLAVPQLAACRACATDVAPDGEVRAVLASAVLRAEIERRLNDLVQTSTGSATRVARIVLLAEPPSLDAGEITDKGSLNSRAILRRRADLAAAAHASATPVGVA
jgi:feruloyl-CoA synthase